MMLETRVSPHVACSVDAGHMGWAAQQVLLRSLLPTVRQRISDYAPLGVGLCLDAGAAEALRDPGTLRGFRDWLHDEHLYVVTLQCAEAAPTLAQLDGLAEILSQLLPEWPGLEGTITSPPTAQPSDMLRHAATLNRLMRARGKHLSLAIGPVDDVADVVTLFRDRLCSGRAIAELRDHLRSSASVAELVIQQHVGVALDVRCVGRTGVTGVLDALEAAGIRVCRLQVGGAANEEETRAVLTAVRRRGVCNHLVVERRVADGKGDVANEMVRELEWVAARLGETPPAVRVPAAGANR